MSTSSSPLSKLKAESDRIAKLMKQGVRGELPNFPKEGPVKVGIVMDDKVITIEMPWQQIHDTNEPALAEMILREMRGKKLDA